MCTSNSKSTILLKSVFKIRIFQIYGFLNNIFLFFKGLERLVNGIKSQPYNKSHHHVKINRTQLKNIHTFGRGSISSSIESR